ncbi:MAG: DUF3006 domain-containing protein [Patescibacteria group bacterium]
MKKITATLDRIEGDFGILSINPNGQTVNFPLIFLPADVREGDILRLTIGLDNESGETDRQNAKDILNEILTGDAEN